MAVEAYVESEDTLQGGNFFFWLVIKIMLDSRQLDEPGVAVVFKMCCVVRVGVDQLWQDELSDLISFLMQGKIPR